MLNPRDLLTVPMTGDDDVGDTYSDQPTVTRDVAELGYSLGTDHRRQEGVLPRGTAAATAGLLVASGENVYQVAYKPDAWLIMIPFVTGANVELSQGEGANAAPLARFGPGGAARILGITDAITLRNISTTPCYPVVVAISGCGVLTAADVVIQPGSAVQAK